MPGVKRQRTDGSSSSGGSGAVKVLVTGGSGLVGKAIQSVIEAERAAGGRAKDEEWLFATRYAAGAGAGAGAAAAAPTPAAADWWRGVAMHDAAATATSATRPRPVRISRNTAPPT
jgi:hypothetical protein